MPRKKPPPKPKGAPQVSRQKYEQMFEAFVEKQSVESVRRRVRISWATASKYIEIGDPSRGMESLRERYAKMQKTADRKADYSLARARADTLTLIRAYKTKLAQRIKQIDPAEMSTAIGNEIDRVARLEEELLTKAPPQDTSAEGIFEGWTDEELESFAETGRWPDRPLEPSRDDR